VDYPFCFCLFITEKNNIIQNNNKLNFYSNGKLLITGEYAVLDGAKALALPTKFGQNLIISNSIKNNLYWESLDYNGAVWFTCKLTLPSLQMDDSVKKKQIDIAKTLQFILKEAQKLNPNFLVNNNSIHIKTNLTFDRNWGLGTSSTLINNIANWAKVDAFKLQLNTFGGSAYDIACAQNDNSIIYQLKNNKPIVEVVNFNPNFKNQLYFVYLNKKKNSRIAIDNYQKIKNNKTELIKIISTITNEILKTNSLVEFEKLLQEHENIISNIIKIEPIKQQLFKDYFGVIKSLGAWEGDFILATGNTDTPKYFRDKGYETILSYDDMIL